MLFFGYSFFSQSPLFFHTHFGSSGDDVGTDIIQTLDSQYIAIGYTGGFDASQMDILVTKLDKLGVPIWQKTYGGINGDIAKSIVELPDSSLVFVGYSNSYGNGGYDAILYRVDKVGNLIWRKYFGGADWDFAYSICRTIDGNLIVCGSTYSYGRGGSDAFLLKLDYNGNFLWNKVYGSTKDDDLKKIIETIDGGFIGTGTTKGYGDSLGDIWITKFNSQGDSTWFKTDGGNKMEVGNSIVQDVNGDYLICGGSESFTSGKEDAYIVKYSNSGGLMWYRYYGLASDNEESYDVANSRSTYGSMVITYGTSEQSPYLTDIKTLLLDFDGYYVRGGSFGGPQVDIGYALCNTFDKGYIACGYTDGYNALMKDFFVVKYDSEMTIGPLIVSIDEKHIVDNRKLYPTIISDNKFRVTKNVNHNSDFKIEVFSVYGIKIENLRIEEERDFYQIYLPENFHGLITVSVDNGQLIQKCLVQ